MILRKKKKQQTPQLGDYRVDICYAWWPVKTESGLIWLERYKEIWEYELQLHVSRYPVFGYIFRGEGWVMRQRKRLKSIL